MAQLGYDVIEPSVPPPSLILVEEMTHRVVNEYSRAIAEIRLAAHATSSDDARRTLGSVAERLHHFAEAHRVLQAPPRPGSADLGEQLGRLCLALTAAGLQDQGIRLTLTTEAIELEAERCWRAALIVSELITNAVRHGLKGGPGNIIVEMEIVGSNVACCVTDNGRSNKVNRPARHSAIVSALAADLAGEIRWWFSHEESTALLLFPHRLPEELIAG